MSSNDTPEQHQRPAGTAPASAENDAQAAELAAAQARQERLMAVHRKALKMKFFFWGIVGLIMIISIVSGILKQQNAAPDQPSAAPSAVSQPAQSSSEADPGAPSQPAQSSSEAAPSAASQPAQSSSEADPGAASQPAQP